MSYITIDEAADKWCVKSQTVIKYIYNGYIDGLSVDGNKLLLPDIPAPAVRLREKKLTAEKIYMKILKACNQNLYLNSYILGISEEQFEMCMKQLEQRGCISRAIRNC